MNTARLDISDPALNDAIVKVRSDASPETYCIFGYEGKSKIVLKSCAEGNAFDAIGELDDAEVSYGLLRVGNTRDQESKTVKFVFIVYVGPSVGGMARGRVGGHKGDIKEMIGQSHVDIQVRSPRVPARPSASAPTAPRAASRSIAAVPRQCRQRL